jgi:hypothetical protein
MLDSIHVEIVLFLMRDRCMLSVEHSAVLEIVLDAPDGTPRRQGSCGSSIQSILILMPDWCTVCGERTIDSEIILDAPDGTPR